MEKKKIWYKGLVVIATEILEKSCSIEQNHKQKITSHILSQNPSFKKIIRKKQYTISVVKGVFVP